MSPHLFSLWLLACAFLSGLAGLVYEVVWLREVGLQFGNTLSATGTVLAAFMAGMVLGSVWLGRRAERTERPLGLYAWLEIGIGLSALLVPAGLRLIDHAGLLLLPNSPGLVVPLSVLVLLVPAVGLGGTLPVLARCLPSGSYHSRTTPGLLYGLATLGAASGACLAAFVLLPSLGSWQATVTAALINGLVGGGCFLLRGTALSVEAPARPSAPASRQTRQPAATLSPWVVLVCLGLSGYAALMYEVVWTRLLGLLLENTVYAFSLMLSTFLLSLALGSFISTRLPATSSPATLLGRQPVGGRPDQPAGRTAPVQPGLAGVPDLRRRWLGRLVARFPGHADRAVRVRHAAADRLSGHGFSAGLAAAVRAAGGRRSRPSAGGQ